MSENKIKSLELFEGLSAEELTNINRVADCLHFKNNEVLFVENSPILSIYIILFGSFKMLRQGGRETPVIFSFLGRNEALGISVARLPSPRYPVTAVANEQSAVLRIKLSDFNRIVAKNRVVEQRVYMQLLRRFTDFQEDRCLEKTLASQKLADFLLRTLDRQSQSCRHQIIIPLTRKDIAYRIGTENETVVRLLSQWTKNKWIQTHSKHIEILNRQALMELIKPPLRKERSAFL